MVYLHPGDRARVPAITAAVVTIARLGTEAGKRSLRGVLDVDNKFLFRFLDPLPDRIPLSDLVRLLADTERLITDLWQNQEADSDLPLFSLVGIVQGSTGLQFATDDPGRVFPLVEAGFTAIARNDYSSLPKLGAKAAESLAAAIRRWGRAEVHVNDQVIPIDVKPPVQAASEIVSGRTVLYGTLQMIGGSIKPAATISPDSEGKAIRCYLDKELVKALAPRIYTRIGVEGLAEYDTSDWSIRSFTIDRILDYEDVPIGEALDAIYKASPTAWEGVSDIAGFISRMRCEEDDDEC